ncbi:MAG: class I SAM-dependent methyltransferase [Desulfobacteraceae bacterium]|nr:class I SAM-dependent methyltransferase [Desulfobacteraceae bacterium]
MYLPQHGHILDVGYGVGRASYGLIQLGYKQITGIDCAPAMIDQARQLVVSSEGRVTFSVQNVCHLACPDNTYNGAVAFHGITPIPGHHNRKRALTHLHQALAPSSHLVLSTFLREQPDFTTFWQEEQERRRMGKADHLFHELGDKLVHKHEAVSVFLHIPSHDEFTVILEESGFTVIESISWEAYNISH